MKFSLGNIFRLLFSKSNPAQRFSVEQWQRGDAMGYPSDPDAILKAINVEVWAYVSINTIGKSLSAAPLIVEHQQTKDSERTWAPLESGPLVDLITQPNEREPMDVLIWRTIMSLLSGDAYWVRPDDGTGLYHVHTPLVKVIPTEDGIEGYRIGRPPNTQFFPPEQVIHFSMPNPAHEFYGLSPLEPVKQHTLINFHYTRYIKNFFKNGALPLGWLSTEQSVDSDIIAKTRKEWNKLYGGDSQHSIGIGGDGITYQSISPPLADLVVDTLYKMPREAILAAFGMPPVLAGLFEYANYANSDQQIKIFWENTVAPMQRLIAGFLNIQLVKQFGDNLRLRFDTTKIPALQEDQEKKAKRVTMLVKGGVITPNEGRKEYNLEEIEGGDELRASSGPAFGMGAEGESGADKSLGQPSPAIIRVASPTKAAAWEAHYKNVKRQQKNLVVLVRRYFDGQLDRLLEALDGITLSGKPSAALLYSFLISTKDGADDDAERLFDIKAENVVLGEAVNPFMRESVHRAGQQAIDRVGIEATFRLDNPEVQTIIDAFENRITYINDSTYKDIKKILRQGYDEGLGIDEIERRIRDKYKMFSKGRAKRIAATEMNGMVNGGAKLGYKMADVEKLAWSSAFLSNSRQTHMDADGQVIDINEKFMVGDDLLEAPGDPNGSVGNIVNCYCGVTPVE